MLFAQRLGAMNMTQHIVAFARRIRWPVPILETALLLGWLVLLAVPA
jgi:hypothetical protein